MSLTTCMFSTIIITLMNTKLLFCHSFLYKLLTPEDGFFYSTICFFLSNISPSFTRIKNSFFETFLSFLVKNPGKTSFHSSVQRTARSNFIEGAAVPIITIQFVGIKIDSLFARLASKEIGEQLDMSDDSVEKSGYEMWVEFEWLPRHRWNPAISTSSEEFPFATSRREAVGEKARHLQ